MATKKNTKSGQTKTSAKHSKVWTAVAMSIGVLLLLAGLAIVIVRLVSGADEPNCCVVEPEYPVIPRYDDPDEPRALKPVLYLYPEEETEVTVSFEKPEYLTTTYPKYVDSWTVTAQPNGDLRDANGNYYYALYWEEDLPKKEITDGFYVEKDDAITFLEEKLPLIGLNDRERNEFIMYWLPVLEQNGKSFVHFDLTEERQKDNKLMITPAPDSLLRINMYVKKVDENPNLPEQILPSFERKGFAAVEWGGTNL